MIFLLILLILLIFFTLYKCDAFENIDNNVDKTLYIITPIRDRDQELENLINSYKRVLNKQKIQYKIYAIEQEGLYLLAISGADPVTSGDYQLDLRIAGDINADGLVDKIKKGDGNV